MPITIVPITPVATAIATVSLGVGPVKTVTIAVPTPVKTTVQQYNPIETDPVLHKIHTDILEKISRTAPLLYGPFPADLTPIESSSAPVEILIPQLASHITTKCKGSYSDKISRTKGVYYAPLILRASKKHKIPPFLLANLFWHESNYNPREISSSGALGLGQIMPLWFRHFHTPLSQWSDPHTNINLTCQVLNFYHTQTSQRYPHISPTNTWHRTLVAYNMGFNRVSRGTYRSRYSTFILRDINLKTP